MPTQKTTPEDSSLEARLRALEARVKELSKKVDALPNGDMMARLQALEAGYSKLKVEMSGLRNDMSAVGHEVATVGGQLAAEILMSEDRLLKAMKELFIGITEAQGDMRATLVSRPCIMEELKVKEDAAKAGHEKANNGTRTDERSDPKSE